MCERGRLSAQKNVHLYSGSHEWLQVHTCSHSVPIQGCCRTHLPITRFAHKERIFRFPSSSSQIHRLIEDIENQGFALNSQERSIERGFQCANTCNSRCLTLPTVLRKAD